jgi:hypothetical protein
MKAKQFVAFSVLALGLQGVAHATYPSDAEASFDLPASQTYAERQAAMGESSLAWGVSKREVQAHNPFPSGGGQIDD